MRRRGIKRGLCLLALLLSALITVACGKGEKPSEKEALEKETLEKEELLPLENLVEAEDGRVSCSYGDTERTFLLCKAETKECKGIVFMLHGYGNDGENFRRDTGFDEDACPKGYVVVYVDGIANAADATSATGWNSGIGESASDDVGFLKSLAAYLQEKYELSKNETFAAGFSNGAFMTYRLAIEGENYFAGVASVAGMMPKSIWDSKESKAKVSLLQMNGTKDDVVPMELNGSAASAQAPAIEKVIDYFVTSMDLDQQETSNLSQKVTLTRYWSDKKESTHQVWQVLITDGRHSWPDEKLYGFSTNKLILDYFDALSQKVE